MEKRRGVQMNNIRIKINKKPPLKEA